MILCRGPGGNLETPNTDLVFSTSPYVPLATFRWT
jgi:hypothetical protein